MHIVYIRTSRIDYYEGDTYKIVYAHNGFILYVCMNMFTPQYKHSQKSLS